MRGIVGVVLLVVLAGCTDATRGGPAADAVADQDADGAAGKANVSADDSKPALVREDLFTTSLAADFGYDEAPAGCDGIPLLAAPKAVLGDDHTAGSDHDSIEVEEDWWGSNFTFIADPGPDITFAWVDEDFSAIAIHRLAGEEVLNGTIPPDTVFGGYAPCEPESATATVEVFRLVADAQT